MPGTEAPRFTFFFYGTLCDADLRRVVTGRPIEAAPAALPDHEAVPAAAGRFPLVQFRRGHAAVGVLCRGVAIAEAARLSLYEGDGQDYVARLLTVLEASGASSLAWVFMPLPALRRGLGRWDLSEWQRFAKGHALRAAARAMNGIVTAAMEGAVARWRARLAEDRAARLPARGAQRS